MTEYVTQWDGLPPMEFVLPGDPLSEFLDGAILTNETTGERWVFRSGKGWEILAPKLLDKN